ncbi:MAG: glycerol kinase GlpK [Ruminococcaceae bacterium]|nr:glycerol kinase GlpK [Oscillospiraceae bacterium]
MSEKKYILALDQGTTSSRAIVFDLEGNTVSTGQHEFRQIYPQPGYVEHDPFEILSSQMSAAREALATVNAEEIAAIGITNQRETTIAWQRSTGRPLYNAIVWQCRRGAPLCEQLIAEGEKQYIKDVTGLVIDSYFSASKMKWLLDNVPEVRRLADAGDLCFGTVDSWLLWNLTGGRVFATDITNACRTMLFDITKRDWDKHLLTRLGIPRSALPEVKPSAGQFGVSVENIFGCAIPITSIAGDQHAAMFGQCCFEEGVAKITYGTGSFILMNVGSKPPVSKSGLLATVAWQIGDDVVYALEGSAFNAGSAIKWLRDELHIIETPQQADRWAEDVEDTAGISFVPAFTGLGAPRWDMYARGGLLGITRGATNKHIARAVLESIALQCCELVDAMTDDSGIPLREIRVDGGVSNSAFVMQYQADLLGIPVLRPRCVETTAIGAAMLAGLGCGVYSGIEELRSVWALDKRFEPEKPAEWAAEKKRIWNKAVERCSGWAEQ